MPPKESNVIPHPSQSKYEKNDESVRFYRLWNARAKTLIQYRNYSIKENAHWGALKELRWASIGDSIEIINIHTGKLISQYTRKLNGIEFYDNEKYEAKPLAA